MEDTDVVVDSICGGIREDGHVADEIDQVERDHATCGEGEGCKLGSDNDGDDIREEDCAEAVEKEDDKKVARSVKRIRSLFQVSNSKTIAEDDLHQQI